MQSKKLETGIYGYCDKHSIPPESLLSFIENEDLYKNIADVMRIVAADAEKGKNKIYKNTIDPFSAVFDSLLHGLTISEWLKQEAARQSQKTLQNQIGVFHQAILGSVQGWKNLGTGNVVDLKSENRMIIAEVKNKFNTTKGNHKTAVYDDLRAVLAKPEFSGYTAYYVEIIPSGGKRYNKPFTPSDNKKRKRRAANQHIRVIDGYSFYALVTGKDNALEQLYSVLPLVVAHHLTGSANSATAVDVEFMDLFNRAYGIST